jgi:hypothetical protein
MLRSALELAFYCLVLNMFFGCKRIWFGFVRLYRSENCIDKFLKRKVGLCSIINEKKTTKRIIQIFYPDWNHAKCCYCLR